MTTVTPSTLAQFSRALVFVALLSTGCHGRMFCNSCSSEVAIPEVPRELNKVTMPEYIIEAPDILQIEAVRIVPKPPFRIEPLDALAVFVTEALPEQPIQGVYVVDPDGTISLGFSYGSVRVIDQTIDEAKASIEHHLAKIVKPGFQVNVSLAESRARQQITGPHLVRQDGKINLGTYGTVPVAGLTLDAAKSAIELHLSQYLAKPEVAVDVAGYNSKVFYVITDNAGFGEAVYRLPLTGNETVLDGLSQTYGLPPTASKKRIWVARPIPTNTGCEQVLPVDWCAITQRGITDSNYQLLPGDRIYVQSQPILTFDATLGKFLAPVERMFGVTLLGTSTIQTIQGRGLFGNNNVQ
jgi:polysaccharide export outer membrane protein